MCNFFSLTFSYPVRMLFPKVTNYGYITNSPKTEQLKTTNTFLTMSMGQESGHTLGRQVPLVRGLSQGYSQGVNQSCIHLKIQLGEDSFSSSLRWLLAGLSSLMAVNWEHQFFAT